jgi:S1-C subfamily serine protease
MITTNVFQRVFYIKYGNETGTCFSIDIDKRQYFITARHVIKGLRSGDVIELFHENLWKSINVKLIGHSQMFDVSVFALHNVSIEGFAMDATTEGLTYSQDVYFLGFPFGLFSNMGELNKNFPLPLVKKEILSAMPSGKDDLLYIDGINNPGFSGGPVVFKPNPQSEFKFAAIISGYQTVSEATLIGDQPTNIKVQVNTGIIIAYSIRIALNLIKENPNGTLLD